MSLKFQTLFNFPVVAIMTWLAMGMVAQGQQKSEQGNPPTVEAEYEIDIRILQIPIEKGSKELPQLLQSMILNLDLEDVEVVGGAEKSLLTIYPEEGQSPKNETESEPEKTIAEPSDSNPSALCLRLGRNELQSFLNYLKADVNANCLQAPTVTTHPNVQVMIQDGANRPFVTGLKKLQNGEKVGFQPVVTAYFEGLEIKLQLNNVRGSQLDLVGNLQRSAIKDVKVISLNKGKVPDAADNPEQQLLQIQFPVMEVVNYPIAETVRLGDGTLIVLGERDQEVNLKTADQTSESKKFFKKTSSESRRFLEVMSVQVTQVTAERTAQRDKIDALPAGSSLPKAYTIHK